MAGPDQAKSLRQSIALLRRVFTSASTVRPLAERHLCAARLQAVRGLEHCDAAARPDLLAARVHIDSALVACREGTRRLRSMIRSDLRVLESRLDGAPELRGTLRTLPRLVHEPYTQALAHVTASVPLLESGGSLPPPLKSGLESVEVLLRETILLMEGDLTRGVTGAKAALQCYGAHGADGRHVARPETVLDDVDLNVPPCSAG